MMAANPYRPWPARITSITDLTATEKLFEFRLVDERIRDAFSHEPGQFVEAEHLRRGRGAHLHFQLAVQARVHRAVRSGAQAPSPRRCTGCSAATSWACAGRSAGGFPFEDMKGHDILLVAGGLGIAPLRSLINNIHDERSEFGKVTIIYGSKTPAEVMFRDQFEMWRHRTRLRPVSDGRPSGRHVGRRGGAGHQAVRALGDRCLQHVRRCVRPPGHVPLRHRRDAQEGHQLRPHLRAASNVT